MPMFVNGIVSDELFSEMILSWSNNLEDSSLRKVLVLVLHFPELQDGSITGSSNPGLIHRT